MERKSERGLKKEGEIREIVGEEGGLAKEDEGV